ADVLLDVRFLPNPHFIPELRKFNGMDRPVIDYLEKSGEVQEAISRFTDLLAYLLPRFEREGKSYLTIGIGCTGGRHRSVMVAESLKKELIELGHKATVTHRDIEKEPERYRR
ncbi:MAG: RapZ C-terminal domain-containing protein, partial [Blastocatellia bacterium]